MTFNLWLIFQYINYICAQYLYRSSPAIDVAEQVLYIGSADQYLYAIYLNGTLRWKFKAGGAINSSPGMIWYAMIWFTCLSIFPHIIIIYNC